MDAAEYRDRSTEQQLSDSIHELAQLCRGWRVAHFRPALTTAGRYVTPVAYEGAGFPDLVLVHPGRKLVLFRELKSAKGRTSDAQVNWINDLRAAGADVDEWRPSDWTRIEMLLRGDS